MSKLFLILVGKQTAFVLSKRRNAESSITRDSSIRILRSAEADQGGAAPSCQNTAGDGSEKTGE